ERQEAVLLGAVEAMDLVDEEQRALAACAFALGLLEGGAQILHAGEDGGELFEVEIGALCEEARDGGLAGAGRAPEDQAGEAALRQHAADGAFGAEEMILADDVFERFRAQAIGQRTRRVVVKACGLEEIAHGGDVARVAAPCQPRTSDGDAMSATGNPSPLWGGVQGWGRCGMRD